MLANHNRRAHDTHSYIFLTIPWYFNRQETHILAILTYIFFFKYFGFEWVNAWPGLGLYIHFYFMAALSLCILFGLWYPWGRWIATHPKAG